jgi:hypothetical protein
MQDVKLADISGTKRGYLKDKIKELAKHDMNKNIRDSCRGIDEFKKGYQLVTN